MLKIIYIAVIVLLVITGLVFAVLNAEPVQFNYYFDSLSIPLSLSMLVAMILGAILGAIVISLLPVGISFLKGILPPVIGQTAGLEPLLFGLIIVLVIVFEPGGLYGRWMKIRFFFETFPYYRKSSFVRQKAYLTTERMR